MGTMKCLDCGKEITEKPCKYCGSVKANIVIKVHDVISVPEVTYLEPIIEVLATPIGKKPIRSEFPISTATPTISGETVPLVADNPEEKYPLVNKFIDSLKDQFDPDKHTIVFKITEEEVEDKGWFSHFDFGAEFNFEKGNYGIKVKGTSPKKTKRKKVTTYEFGLKEKDK